MTNPKPDDRSDNVEKIKNTIDHTLQNIDEARDYVNAHSDQLNSADKKDIENKNKRRKESIEGLRSEIRDEANHNE